MKRNIQYECDACGSMKDAKLFDHGKLHRSHERQAYKVCLACIQMGYSSRDVQAYPCFGCGNKGHLHFSRDALKNYKRPSRTMTLKCKDCSDKCFQMICRACGLKKDDNQFPQRATFRPTSQEAYSVCPACAALGYSERDVEGYPCVGCRTKGHLQFPLTAIQKYNSRQMLVTLTCNDCIRRCREIRGRLLRPGSWRCTCRGTKDTRVHHAGNEKCELFPQYAGEKRWPGKNMKVSQEELQLLERCTKRRRVD